MQQNSPTGNCKMDAYVWKLSSKLAYMFHSFGLNIFIIGLKITVHKSYQLVMINYLTINSRNQSILHWKNGETFYKIQSLLTISAERRRRKSRCVCTRKWYTAGVLECWQTDQRVKWGRRKDLQDDYFILKFTSQLNSWGIILNTRINSIDAGDQKKHKL